MAKRKLSAWQKHVKSYMHSHKGLSFKEALPKAKLTYHSKSSSKSSKSSNPRSSKSSRKVKRKMAKKKRRRSRSITIPLAPIAGLGAGLATPISQALAGNYESAFYYLSQNYTGVDPRTGQFNIEHLKRGLVPLLGGLLVHKFVGGSPLNLNRILARANVPFIRI